MKCIGCDGEMGSAPPAAYAIMHEDSYAELGIAPAILGKGRFHAAGVCTQCYTVPTSRKRVLKAHFALPDSVKVMADRAGSSGQVGG